MDELQHFRMTIIWPVMVGCVAFYFVRFIAGTLDGRLTRWQAVLASICGVMGGIVTMTIARYWSGSEIYWLAFTLGLAFAALVMLANVIMTVLEAGHDG